MEDLTFNDIMDHAIKRESNAYKFYTDLAKKVSNDWIRDQLLIMAEDEVIHKSRLEAIKDQKITIDLEKIEKLHIAEQAQVVKLSTDMDYEDLLIMAMKEEQQAFEFYNVAAALMTDPDLEQTFRTLAQEEARHKNRFEEEYKKKFLGEK